MNLGKAIPCVFTRRRHTGAFAALCCVAVATLCPGLAACEARDPAARPSKGPSTTAELGAAIANARPGEILRLKAGLYEGLVISHVNFKDAITVTSLDPAHPAVISGLKVAASSGLKFSQLELTSAGSVDPTYGFRLQDCDNIVFDDIIAHGDRDIPPSMQKAGFFIIGSSNITVSNSKFDHLGAALVANKNTHVDFHRNLFIQMSKGGIAMGADGFVSIKDNVFTDFRVGRGIHPDGIQIYTAGMPTPSHDIVVTGNLMYRGPGNAIQGIFIQDEGTASPFENLTVADNAVIGGMWDSIYIKHAIGPLVIKDNIAASWPGLDMEGSGDASAEKTAATTTGFTAFLWLRGDMSGAALSMSGNRAQVYMNNAGRIAPPPGNAALGDVKDDGKALLKSWMADHPQLLPLLTAANLPVGSSPK